MKDLVQREDVRIFLDFDLIDFLIERSSGVVTSFLNSVSKVKKPTSKFALTITSGDDDGLFR